MRKVTLTRTRFTDAGTFGCLSTDSGFICFTGELPWRANAPDKSCIPPGRYLCTWRSSSRHGDCYHVEGVPGRTGIEVHAANWMGDAAKGYRCDLLGCIAPGTGVGELSRQTAVLESRAALAALEADLRHEPFQLTIV